MCCCLPSPHTAAESCAAPTPPHGPPSIIQFPKLQINLQTPGTIFSGRQRSVGITELPCRCCHRPIRQIDIEILSYASAVAAASLLSFWGENPTHQSCHRKLVNAESRLYVCSASSFNWKKKHTQPPNPFFLIFNLIHKFARYSCTLAGFSCSNCRD